MTLFRRVLFPTDFSSYADAVADCLPELRAAGAHEIVLMHVIRPGEVPLGHTVDQDLLERVRWGAEQKLHVLSMALEGQGFAVTSRLTEGRPAEEIVRLAGDERVNMIVLGAQGLTPAQELLLGSVAFEVVRTSSVPVLIHKFELIRAMGRVECQRRCANTFARVLHPTDFSESAQAAFHIVKGLRGAGAEEVILLHVQDERAMRHRPPEQLAEFDQIDTARLEQMRKALTLYHLNSRIMLRHGISFLETLKVGVEEEISLIVLGWRGRSPLQEIFAGSTLENVVRRSRRPVLVVPNPTEKLP